MKTNALLFAMLGTVIFFLTCNTAPKSSDEPDFIFEPVEASPNKKRLLNYLFDQYGSSIISGQMDTSWAVNRQNDMIARVFEDTGKFPALKGFDLLQLHADWAPFYAGMEQIDEAIEWWEGKNRMNGLAPSQLIPERSDVHGIVAFCWHWRLDITTDNTPEFYSDRTPFRIPWKNGRLDKSGIEWESIIADLDKVAALFQLLKEKDIPVLWRPLHEASGGWFWWGAKMPDNSQAKRYIALWEFMYGYFTYEKDLNNLIWVWNGQHKDWFPNPLTVDIAGNDVYSNPKDYSSLKTSFNNIKAMLPEAERERMIIALSENGPIPDPDDCLKDGAMWSFFMTWNDGGAAGETDKNNFWAGEYHNTQEHKEKVYNHEKVITLDKLPDLTNYRL